MTIDENKPWPFPSHFGDAHKDDDKLKADCLALLQDFTAFQLRGEIYYGYLDVRALKVIEELRKDRDSETKSST
jgi:hypothetical protein